MAQQFSVLEKLEIFQRVHRDWRPYLTVAERDFLTYMIDNTVSWGRLEFRATVDQMIAGTDWQLAPVGTSRRSVFRLIASLREKGVLVVQTLKRGINRYTINLGWVDDMKAPKNKRERTAGLAKPKTSANLASGRKSQCQSDTPKSSSSPSEKGVSLAAGPQVTSAEKVVAKVVKESRERIERSTDIEDVWRRAWREGGYADRAPRLNKADRGKLLHVVKRWPHGLDVVYHAVANWTEILGRQFAWMTQKAPPTLPAPGFICHFSDQFAEDHATIESRTKFWESTAEEREYERQRKAGLTHDEALLAIGKSRARLDEDAEIAKARKRARDEAGAVEKERYQLALQRKELARRTLAAGRRARPPEPPKLDHGDNPWVTGSGKMADFSKLPAWDESEDAAS